MYQPFNAYILLDACRTRLKTRLSCPFIYTPGLPVKKLPRTKPPISLKLFTSDPLTGHRTSGECFDILFFADPLINRIRHIKNQEAGPCRSALPLGLFWSSELLYQMDALSISPDDGE
jgi:hypothetical protein